MVAVTSLVSALSSRMTPSCAGRILSGGSYSGTIVLPSPGSRPAVYQRQQSSASPATSANAARASQSGCGSKYPSKFPLSRAVIGEGVHRSQDVVGDAVRLTPAHGPVGVADLDDLVGAGIAQREPDGLFGRIRDRADLEAVDPQMRVVPAVPNGDVPEDAVLLL